jgi:hypothetical protein
VQCEQRPREDDDTKLDTAKRTWRAPMPLEDPSIVAAAFGVVVVEEHAPWRAVTLDATSGAIRHELHLDPCRQP